MNDKVETSLAKFVEWQPKYSTHADRLMGLIRRHTDNVGAWKRMIETHPVNSPEFYAEVNRIHTELTELLAEFSEVMHDLGMDNQGLADIFMAFHQELKEATNDTP